MLLPVENCEQVVLLFGAPLDPAATGMVFTGITGM